MFKSSDNNKRFTKIESTNFVSSQTRHNFQSNQKPQRNLDRSWRRVDPVTSFDLSMQPSTRTGGGTSQTDQETTPSTTGTSSPICITEETSLQSVEIARPPVIKPPSVTDTQTTPSSPTTPTPIKATMKLSPGPGDTVKISLPKQNKTVTQKKTRVCFNNYYVDWSPGKSIFGLEDINVDNLPSSKDNSDNTALLDKHDAGKMATEQLEEWVIGSRTDNEMGQWIIGSTSEKRTENQKARSSWQNFTSQPDFGSPVNLALQQQQEKNNYSNSSHDQTQGFIYSHFMGYNDVLAAIAKGELYKCQIRINQRDTRDAYGISEVLDDDIYLYGTSARNRALDGDIVAVRLLDVEEVWQERKENNRRMMEKRQRQRQQKAEELGEPYQPEEEEVDDEEDDRKPRYAGEVVFILDREEGVTFTGVIFTSRPGMPENSSKSVNDIKHVWFKPTNRCTPLIMIDVKNAPADIVSNAAHYEKQIMEVAITRWSADHRIPSGKVIRCLGPIGNLDVEQKAILADKNIMNVPFDDLVLKYVGTLSRSIPAKELVKRRDLRHEQILTIDPPTAKDLDDALHIKRLDDGCYEVGVHIADVTYYVKQNSVLDSEVEKRGTTTYLTNKSIPMLPPVLSEDLCSLNPQSDKLTFSIIWKLDQSGNIKNEWIGHTVIRSCAKLTYDDAQCVIDNGYLPKNTVVEGHSRQKVEESIMDLFKLSSVMRKRRYEEGALSLNSIKLSFILDDKESPIGVSVVETREANKLVEEFMLLANSCVAKKIYDAYPFTALLRRHQRPIERRLGHFRDVAKKLGYDMNVDSGGDLQNSFNDINDLAVKDILLLLAIHPMRKANYICSGAARNNNFLHYALNLDQYTHFTSPIRRYADIIVHRLLDATISGKEDCGYDTKMIQEKALQCNRKNDGAKKAQQADTMLFLADYLHKQQKTKGIQMEEAVVIGVGKKRFDIYVPAYGLEYSVQLDALPLKQYEFNKGQLNLYWKPGERVDTVVTASQHYGSGEDNIRSDPQVAQLARGIMDTSLGDYDDYDYMEDYYDDSMDDIPRTIHPTSLDHDTHMQSIDILATLHVNPIPDKSKPLTRIHIFPVNPF